MTAWRVPSLRLFPSKITNKTSLEDCLNVNPHSVEQFSGKSLASKPLVFQVKKNLCAVVALRKCSMLKVAVFFWVVTLAYLCCCLHWNRTSLDSSSPFEWAFSIEKFPLSDACKSEPEIRDIFGWKFLLCGGNLRRRNVKLIKLHHVSTSLWICIVSRWFQSADAIKCHLWLAIRPFSVPLEKTALCTVKLFVR